MTSSAHATEVETGQRFEFGKNWARFLWDVDEHRIENAEASLSATLGIGALRGARFLDAGSGSGLFSLAARGLGATVHSFDYDPLSVRCTLELRRRYREGDPNWTVEEGSVLDRDYLRRLGTFDVVYSWGVLHHTGAMWQAIGNVCDLVAPGGVLLISIYNDQGRKSTFWRSVKRTYNSVGPARRLLLLVAVAALLQVYSVIPFARNIRQQLRSGAVPKASPNPRGMSRWSDLVDWVGGYPFEVATPAAIAEFCNARGLELTAAKTTTSAACNEFVFRRAGKTGGASSPAVA